MELEKGALLWFTGFISSGKTTVAREVERILRQQGVKVENLDADEWRANMSPDLKHGPQDRDLNTKRLAFVGSLLARNGVVAIVAAESPLRAYRDRGRRQVDHFMEIWVKCPIEVCQQRDPKGIFKKAAEGKINDISGLHQPYEEPLHAEVVLETHKESMEQSARKVLLKLAELHYVPRAVVPEPDAVKGEPGVYSQVDEEKVKKRLEDLGYL
jgi:adenylylsulfate kinase